MGLPASNELFQMPHQSSCTKQTPVCQNVMRLCAKIKINDCPYNELQLERCWLIAPPLLLARDLRVPLSETPGKDGDWNAIKTGAFWGLGSKTDTRYKCLNLTLSAASQGTSGTPRRASSRKTGSLQSLLSYSRSGIRTALWNPLCELTQ